MNLKFAFSAAALCALAACSGKSGPSAEPSASAVATAIPSDSPEAKLTMAYLKGPWCYVRDEAGGEENAQNISYEFADDGTLKYQASPGAPVDQPGSYTLSGGLLTIKPVLEKYKYAPVTVRPDAMILETIGRQAIWARGVCAG